MIRALAVTGPTASGKTAVSLELADHLSAHIVCCDSMQIYKYMDIGTAKPTAEERARAPHFMTDFLLPGEDYSAQSYRKDALAVARSISESGHLPLFVGGTGLYIDTLLRGDGNAVPESDPEYTSALLSENPGEEGKERLWRRLAEIDPHSAEKTHKNNVRRVIRALEIFDKTGKTKTYFDELSRNAAGDISIGMITLDFHNRDNLYRRVDERVDEMMRQGLLAEAEWLLSSGNLILDSTAGQAIGYKELIGYFKGELSLTEAVEHIKLSTRRYAKRQLTWFRHCDAVRIYLDGEDGIMKKKDTVVAEAINAADRLLNCNV